MHAHPISLRQHIVPCSLTSVRVTIGRNGAGGVRRSTADPLPLSEHVVDRNECLANAINSLFYPCSTRTLYWVKALSLAQVDAWSVSPSKRHRYAVTTSRPTQEAGRPKCPQKTSSPAITLGRMLFVLIDLPCFSSTFSSSIKHPRPAKARKSDSS